MSATAHKIPSIEVTIPVEQMHLPGLLAVPERAGGVVVFAHGSGSGRFSPRNQAVAGVLQQAGLATLLLDLLSEEEAADRRNVFNIELLAERLLVAATWLRAQPNTRTLGLGYFGASTGGGAALVAAARQPELVRAVVSRGGRPDLAGDHLRQVQASTLLLVGSRDPVVRELNEQALRQLTCPRELVIIPGATHLFPEPGTLEEVAQRATLWFNRYLRKSGAPSSNPRAGQFLFRDREDAGRQLAERLKERKLHRPLVLAIPRGGVVIGAALAQEIGAELDVVLARKLRAPFQPELAIGAISEDGRSYLNEYAHQLPGFSADYLAAEQERQLQEIGRRRQLLRQIRPQALPTERSVLVVDDGIATGSTMKAALKVVRAQKPRELLVAVPVACQERLEEVAELCDEVVCLLVPPDFYAVGAHYQHFPQVGDDEVLALLSESASQLSR